MLKTAIELFDKQSKIMFAEIAKNAVMRQQIGKVIRSSRIESNYSLRELAKQVGISAPYLSDIELGRRFPSKKVLDKIVELSSRPSLNKKTK